MSLEIYLELPNNGPDLKLLKYFKDIKNFMFIFVKVFGEMAKLTLSSFSFSNSRCVMHVDGK
jgi:hypothetical protein